MISRWKLIECPAILAFANFFRRQSHAADYDQPPSLKSYTFIEEGFRASLVPELSLSVMKIELLEAMFRHCKNKFR